MMIPREPFVRRRCDAIDGPVAESALVALAAADVSLILPYARASDEPEIKERFRVALGTGRADAQLVEPARTRFFETAVRLHRLAEGAAYTGLQPAGSEPHPIVPIAERAIISGLSSVLQAMLPSSARAEMEQRFAEVRQIQVALSGDLAGTRESLLGLHGFLTWIEAAAERPRR